MIAPIDRTPVSASVYKLPEKISTPAVSSQHTDDAPFTGNVPVRGSIETTGQFALNNKWTWGWDGILPTDPTFIQNYGLSTYQRGSNILVNGLTEGVSQLYLAGRGDRSYFDMRAIYYYGFSEADTQGQIPRIHPVVDYDYVFGQPVLGGELSYRANLTSLSRSSADFNPIMEELGTRGLGYLDDGSSNRSVAPQLASANGVEFASGRTVLSGPVWAKVVSSSSSPLMTVDRRRMPSRMNSGVG